MKTLNIAIVDDSVENIQTIEFLLGKSNFPVNVIAKASTLKEAKIILSNPLLDLVFLDIQLKKGTIFEVLKKLHESKELQYEIVFVTAHGSFEFAVKAIRYACLDFIMKPIDLDQLNGILKRAVDQQEIQYQQHSKQMDFFLHFLNSQRDYPTSIGIVLPKGIIEFVELSEIAYFKADGSVCDIFLHRTESITSTKHLGYYIDLLQDNLQFIQISKNLLINTNHIKKYNHKSRLVMLHNGTELNASVRFSKGLKKNLLDRQNPSSLLRNFRKLMR